MPKRPHRGVRRERWLFGGHPALSIAQRVRRRSVVHAQGRSSVHTDLGVHDFSLAG